MLLLNLFISLAAGSLAFPSVSRKPTSHIKLPTIVKSSIHTKTSFIKLASTTKRTKYPVTHSLSARPIKRQFAPVKLSVTGKRVVPSIVSKVPGTRNSPINKRTPNIEHVGSMDKPGNHFKKYLYDDEVPADLKNFLSTQQVKSKNPSNNKILKEIKTKLQQGNDDYLDKEDDSQQADIATNNPNIMHGIGFESGKQNQHFNFKNRYLLSQRLYTNYDMKTAANSSKRRLFNPNRNYRRAGVTTPSQYEIKPYKRKHKKKKHAKNLRQRQYHRFGPKKGRQIKRRHEVGLNTLNDVITNATLISETTTTNKEMKPSISNPSTMLNSYTTEARTTATVITQPLEVFTTIPSEYGKPSTSSSPTFRVNTNNNDQTNRKEGLTTLSAFEIHSEQKQKKLERFVKFINKNRSLLREFVAKKKDKKEEKKAERAGEGIFRGGGGHVESPPHQLDLAPAKGNKIEALRVKGRICQRNLMIPEGPKYNSMGCTYMPEFKRKPGYPDYPSTKKRVFLIPACCNCCKKSVLGCE